MTWVLGIWQRGIGIRQRGIEVCRRGSREITTIGDPLTDVCQ